MSKRSLRTKRTKRAKRAKRGYIKKSTFKRSLRKKTMKRRNNRRTMKRTYKRLKGGEPDHTIVNPLLVAPEDGTVVGRSELLYPPWWDEKGENTLAGYYSVVSVDGVKVRRGAEITSEVGDWNLSYGTLVEVVDSMVLPDSGVTRLQIQDQDRTLGWISLDQEDGTILVKRV